MRGNTQMQAVMQRPRMPILAAAIAFIGVLIPGAVLTAVIGLFAYANAPDPNTHDSRFLTILITGVAISLIASIIAATRSVRTDVSNAGEGAAYTLLKKYRRVDTRPGGDSQTGQYRIGEQYLRELLGRRGA